MAIVKSKLLKQLSDSYPNFLKKDLEKFTNIIFREIKYALKRGDRVELRGFGIFSTNIQRARISRNPKTGEPVSLSSRHVPHFKPGKDLRERVNSKMNDVTKSDEPLSGYYNRLFPVKFVMRMFTILILNSEAYDKENGWDPEMELDDQVSLSHLRDKSAQTAKYAREWLKQIDVDSGSERGSEYSTGFPEDEKSRERFVAQFVGSKRKNKLSGAIFDIGFANIRSFMGIMNADDLYMTLQGWNFATLENPLLDSMDGWLKGIRFSEQESKFLLEHFEKNSQIHLLIHR